MLTLSGPLEYFNPISLTLRAFGARKAAYALPAASTAEVSAPGANRSDAVRPFIAGES